ncbi:DUF3108 domain-containing protein [Frateuria terrea]|uniref:DUF3108 domain-containing protein n=1 Tax=Frateuria terrea TaxID=529704 RepID=A0A1H6YUM7_9GAMM|nr:DUF3108 domain-containing protein [Frateuria terrea]SEJ43514.1 Protein of unknown function [Frateuria terrea]SFP72380.1 Protein of unknown function [Frateuria terrea]
MTIRLLLRFALALLLCAASGLVFAATPKAFTATYRVLRDGSPMGEATVSLKPLDNGQWEYSKHVRGTSGLAAMLGANLDEVSHFRWKGDVPEAISYDYRLDAAIKTKQRHVTVDWGKHRVTVDEGKGATTYPSQPGMVERNTTALAIGLALRDGQKKLALPVAVKQDVETQRFQATGREKIIVPAGSFDTVRVDRTDADRGFSAWYAPERYPLPVKLSQKDGGDLTMELVSFR